MDVRHDFLAGGGEMGARIRAMNWSATPLGPVERWPQSLRSAVSILLPSKAQIALFWGPELVTLYNDAYRPVFGAKHPAALGKPIRESWDELWRAGLKELFDGVLATGEAFWAQDRPFFMERHGYLEETYFDVSYDPVRDESGRVAGVFCIVAEKTGRVVGERRLRALRDLRGIGQQAHSVDDVYRLATDALAAYSEDVPFTQLYSAEATPPRLETACGLEGARDWPFAAELRVLTDFAELHAGPYPEPLSEVVSVPFALAGEPDRGWLVAGVNPRRRLDDDYRDFLRLAASNIGAALAAARRVEDERRRARLLAELDRAKTAFFSNVSHEFRTPLTLMLGPVDDALADGAHPLAPAQRERLELVRRSGLRLQKLVNTLLDFARIEAGRAQASYVETDLCAFTAELASSFRSAMEKAGLDFTVECPAFAARAWVDREMWEKIVLNLLSNAFKFTFEGGVRVSLKETGTGFELAVRDTGTGIPAAELPHVFERFRRVEGARSRTHEGTGIGLALVQELVRLHGGEVAVESAEGRGSTFTVRIPAGSAHLPQERVGAAPALASTVLPAEAFVEEALRWLPAAAPAAAPAGEPSARILLADDNADMREYVRRILAERYEVEALADGAAALASARARRPDLVLADVMMPGLDGLGLTRALRADPALRDVPVILLSARAGEDARIEGVGAGADDYLEKPFAARELIARVAARLEVARLRREAEAALLESDRRKDEFIATLSHELRNPLAPLQNALQLLRMKRSSDPQLAEVQEMMERQVKHLVRLVDDLLEMSRITRGALELRRERVELAVVVRNAIETSEPLMRGAGHRLEVALPPGPVWLDGDPVRLAQILGNLLNNAARYTPKDGAISLRAQAHDRQVSVAVRDNGIGFAPAEAARLFEMFSRGRASSGLGIGLALSRRLAQMHGGSLEAASAGPGQGAEFTLRLPLAAAPAERASGGSRPADMARKRILIVDDNRDAADSLRLILEALGAEVRVARDGREALEAFGAHDPAIVLLDIGMPGMDGYEVARAMRLQYPERRAAIVALTGWGQEEDRRRGRAAGFDYHLVKPADLPALEALVASIDEPGPRPSLH
jgi:signal transduction histidine kinase